MFLELIVPLMKYLSVLNVFRYITFRTASAFVVSLLICFIFGPKVIDYLRKLKAGQSIRDDGPGTHLKKSGTPTMGGLLILIGLTISVLLFANLKNPYVIIAVIATLQFGIVGFVDDYLKVVKKDTKGLAGRFKIIMQVFIALSVVTALFLNPLKSSELTKLYVPFFSGSIIDLGIIYIPFAVLLLVGISNAVNLADGLDGLAIGLTIFVAVAFSAMAYLSGHFNIANYLKIPFLRGSAELAVFSGALLGAGVGFLWYNCHPAQMFMGDTGSLALGGAIGVIALMIKKEMLLIIIGGVFLVEALSVIIQVGFYKWKKRRVFKMAPLHHHYELKGWDENKVVIRFWIIGALLTIISLATLKIR
ncbi:MAG: phospho-N-acetylmuramoyl-pentapeptide-transferase [Spirochaetes bacterium]|nr:phospho-N-acetylmuramoyl-pentapeptide-transferase [Spirochaetota bacterium]